MKKRWTAILCALALTLGLTPATFAAGEAETHTGSITAGPQWHEAELRVPQDVREVKLTVKCDTGVMNVELLDVDRTVIKPMQTLDANSEDNSFVYYIKRADGYYGSYHLRWRGVNGYDATGTYSWEPVDNEAASVHLANPRKSGAFTATASWDGLGLQVGENVEIFRLVVACDAGSMTVRVVDDNNHLVMPTQFLTADSDSEASSFNFTLHRAEGYTGSYALWWIGADGQTATGSYSWAPVLEGGFEPGMEGQIPAPTVTEGENTFRWPYQNIELHGGGGGNAGCAFFFKLENNENYFRVAVRNDMAPELGNITVGVYAQGDSIPYVSYQVRPGEWTEPFVFRGVPGTTYKVVLRKSAATPELVEGLLSIRCAPGVFE